MAANRSAAELERFLAARADHLLRTAVLLTGSREAGEDMLQRQRVDGIKAIKLTSRKNSLISETIWVSPGTYLPVRVVVRPALGGTGLKQTADITWLPPTAQNLAKLTVPIPRDSARSRSSAPCCPSCSRSLAGCGPSCPACQPAPATGPALGGPSRAAPLIPRLRFSCPQPRAKSGS